MRNVYEWYPLSRLVGMYLREPCMDILNEDFTRIKFHSDREVVAVCELVLPTEVVFEMRGRDPFAPIYTLYRDDPDNWDRIQREINAARSAAALRYL